MPPSCQCTVEKGSFQFKGQKGTETRKGNQQRQVAGPLPEAVPVKRIEWDLWSCAGQRLTLPQQKKDLMSVFSPVLRTPGAPLLVTPGVLLFLG